MIVSVADLLPVAVGLKLTWMEHAEPAANGVGQFVVVLESLGLAPLSVMLLMVKGAVPLFVSVTDVGILATPTTCDEKLRLVDDRTTDGATPVPLSGTICVAETALSITMSEPASLPVVAGVKVTTIGQLAPGATEVPQKSLAVKSPLVVMLPGPRVRTWLPMVVKVTIWLGLVAPTSWSQSARCLGKG